MNLNKKVTDDILSLPAENRLELVDILIKSLNIPTNPKIDKLWMQEIEKRIKQIDNGETKLVNGEDVFNKIKGKLAN